MNMMMLVLLGGLFILMTMKIGDKTLLEYLLSFFLKPEPEARGVPFSDWCKNYNVQPDGAALKQYQKETSIPFINTIISMIGSNNLLMPLLLGGVVLFMVMSGGCGGGGGCDLGCGDKAAEEVITYLK